MAVPPHAYASGAMTDPHKLDEPDVPDHGEGLPDVVEADPTKTLPDEGDKGKP